MLLIELITGWLPAWLASINQSIFSSFNSLAGHSIFLDDLISLCLENDLIKAGVIGASLVAVWYSGGKGGDIIRARKILIATLIAAAFVVATTKTISHAIFFPRPFVQTERMFLLEHGQLVESTPVHLKVPLDDSSQTAFRNLQEGTIDDNDLESIPSDHAGFFLVIAFGIWLVSRRAGAIALGWTILGIITAKMIAGQHTPLDVAAGAAIAVFWFSACQWAARHFFDWPLSRIAQLTVKFPGLAHPFVFLAVFEITRTLADLKPILKTGAHLAHLLVKGGA